jgi:hypothetical protein
MRRLVAGGAGSSFAGRGRPGDRAARCHMLVCWAHDDTRQHGQQQERRGGGLLFLACVGCEGGPCLRSTDEERATGDGPWFCGVEMRGPLIARTAGAGAP